MPWERLEPPLALNNQARVDSRLSVPRNLPQMTFHPNRRLRNAGQARRQMLLLKRSKGASAERIATVEGDVGLKPPNAQKIAPPQCVKPPDQMLPNDTQRRHDTNVTPLATYLPPLQLTLPTAAQPIREAERSRAANHPYQLKGSHSGQYTRTPKTSAAAPMIFCRWLGAVSSSA